MWKPDIKILLLVIASLMNIKAALQVPDTRRISIVNRDNKTCDVDLDRVLLPEMVQHASQSRGTAEAGQSDSLL